MNRYLLALLMCLVLSISCKEGKRSQESPDILISGDTLIIKEGLPVEKEIVTEVVLPKSYSAEFRTVGTVRAVPGKFAEITPPFTGRVIKSSVTLGQKISAGDPVLELGSSDFYESAKGYFSAQNAYEIAVNAHNRQKDLSANGVASQKDLEQARSEAFVAKQELEQAEANIRIFNIDPASLKTGQPLKITTPISGEVVKYNMTIGSYIKEDSEPLAVIADLSKVWVVALVKEKYFGSIKKGDRVEIYTDANPNKRIWGEIRNIGEILDEETRSLEVIVECNNSERDLKIGMFCEVHFLSAPTTAIILPSDAIMQEQGSCYLFVKLAKGHYLRRKVVAETISKRAVRIVNGVKSGENIVVSGGIYLNI